MRRKYASGLALAVLLLSPFFSLQADVRSSSGVMVISPTTVLTLNAGTTRSPQEFTQPVKMGEAVQTSVNVNVDTINQQMQEAGTWTTPALLDGVHYQFVFYPDNLTPVGLEKSEPEGASSLFQINGHPEVGMTLAIKDSVFPAVPLVVPSPSGYLCFFGTDNTAPVAQCGYREGVTTANLSFTTRLYLLPPSVARRINENAYNTAEPIMINDTISLGRIVIGRKLCNLFSCHTYDAVSYAINLKLQINAVIEPASCGLVGGALDRTIDMGEISQGEMNQATGPLYRNKAINLQFKCPSYANIKVNMYIEDLIHPTNNSNILSYTMGDGYADGVGIALQGQGPNDAAPVDLRLTKNHMRTVIDTNNSTGFNYVITPYLYKTGPVSSGIIEAKAKIVFQYD